MSNIRSRMRCFPSVILVVAIVATLLQQAQAQDVSTPAALDQYSLAANLQNAKEYDQAIAEWQNFITKFPKDPLLPQAQHYQGVCYLQLATPDQAKAAAVFEAVITDHPKFEKIEESYLYLGSTQFTMAQGGQADLYPKAATTFGTLVTKFPKGKFLDQALYFQGEALYLQGKKDAAVKAYQALADNHPKSGLRADGLYALGVTQEELKQYPAAGKSYDIFLTEFADNNLFTEVRMRKAETVAQAGTYADAETLFGEVAAVEGFASADHALYRQAYCALQQEKFAEAGALYAKIPTEFKDSEYVPDSTLDAGRCFYRAKQYDNAAKWFDKVVAGKSPQLAEAAHWRCRIHLRNSEYGPAAKLAKATLPKAADSEYLVNLMMDEADAVFETEGKQADALALYGTIATDHADHDLAPQALYNAAFAAMQLKKYEEAIGFTDAFTKANAEHSLSTDVKYVAAESNLLLNKLPEAEVLYTELVTISDHADLEQWQMRLGLSQYLQKKYKETVAMFTPVIATLKSKDNQAEANFLVGTSQYYLADYAAAAKSLTASLDANPKWRQSDEALLNLARSQGKTNNATDARKNIEKLIKNFPESTLLDRAHFRLAQYTYEMKEFKTSAAEYALVAKNWPDSVLVPHALYGQGWAELRNGGYEPAEAAFTALLTGFEEHRLVAETHNARAMCRRHLKNFPGGIEDVNAYLMSEPEAKDKADALYIRSLCEVGLKKYDDAIVSLDAVLTASPDYPTKDKVIYEKAWAYKASGKEEDAIKAFTQLATEHVDSSLSAEANYHVGESFYDNKEYAEAVKAYAAAKAKVAKGELAEKTDYKHGWSQFQLKQYAKALASFEQQVKEYPQGSLNSDGQFMVAECNFKLEIFEPALAAYQAAEKAGTLSKNIQLLVLLHGGQAAAQLENYEEAVRMLAQIPEKHADSPLLPEALYEQGFALQNLKKHEEAIALYTQVTDKSRGEIGARARFMWGEVLFTDKDFSGAISQFQKVMYGYGGSAAGADIKNWQAKSGFEAARCAEVQIEKAKAAARTKAIADAKKYYGYVTKSHPTHSLATDATKRMTALNKLK